MENISTIEESRYKANLVLFKNNIRKDGTYYARVSRDTASVSNLISEAIKKHPGIDPYMMKTVIILIQQEILDMIARGKAVNLLDIGSLYLTYKCKANGISDAAVNGVFDVGFTPSSLTNETVKKLNVASIVYGDNSPVIDVVCLLPNNETNIPYNAGNVLKIGGKHLKLGGTVNGIWFAPVDIDNNPVKDESSWIKIEEKSIIRNKPRELNVVVPFAVPSGTYCLVVRTSIQGSVQLKKPLTGVSRPVEIA